MVCSASRRNSCSSSSSYSPGGHLAVELELVGLAQLGLADPAATRSVRGGRRRRSPDEGPGHGDDGDAEVLLVVGEEHREGRGHRQGEAAGDQQPARTFERGARGDRARATTSSSRGGMAPA